MRGGANGARITLEPQKNWEVNNPNELAKNIVIIDQIRKDFNKKLNGNKKVSLADAIIIAGNAGIEKSASKAGIKIKVPFNIGRVDALQSQTDIASFAILEPKSDGFRNYHNKDNAIKPIEAMIDKASLLNLRIPEMTALIGGLRVLSANYDNSNVGVLTTKPNVLTNDFFVNLLDMSNEWKKSDKNP
jgi:catalase-peroxidase